MSTLVVVLRAVSLAFFAAPLLLPFMGHARGARARRSGSDRLPVFANFAAFILFFVALVVFRSSPEGLAALTMAAGGCLLALAGAVLILRSRIELGAAWSLVPAAGETTGLVTTGPYRLVRHPIYLSFLLLTGGEALAFASWPAALVLLGGIVPSFVWRARREDALLAGTFGERHHRYRKRTGMIIPYLL